MRMEYKSKYSSYKSFGLGKGQTESISLINYRIISYQSKSINRIMTFFSDNPCILRQKLE